MSYGNEYAAKLCTAEEAVKIIKSGDWIDYGWCAGHPVELDRALAERMGELENLKIRGGIALWRPAIFDVPDAAKHFCWNSWHMSGIERKAVKKGIAYYSPVIYSELPRYYRENIDVVNVAMFQVAPMDCQGYFNFGPSTSHMKDMCRRADVVIVEVNENMPRCLGGYDTDIHISQVDHIVEGENPQMGTLSPGNAGEVDEAIARFILEEIPDGACLQLGIGGMPNVVGSLITQSDLKDLGVHTEIYVDAFVDMSRAGKINGSRKTIDRGRQVYTFAAGTQKVYDFLNNNPECMAAPSEYTNDIGHIAALNQMISINNAVDLDLFGQVNAESKGIRHISGAGGQINFVLGACLSKGGKSFICCSSTFTERDGQVKSRILPTLDLGTVVTEPRANIQYLVTEYGKVNLKGLSVWQRAEAIISVAHPDFREELAAEAEKMHIWRRSNKR